MKIKSIYKYTGFAFFLLLCLTLFTLSQVNDAKSKYKSDSNGTSNTVVAKWDVSVTPITQNNILNVVVGNTVDYTLEFTSYSEVSCNYTIILSNVPNGLKVYLDGGTEHLPVDNIVTFTNAGTLSADTSMQSRTHTLSFSADMDTDSFDDDIDIDVTFTQID